MKGRDAPIDFGWRLKGQQVQVLPDRSWKLPGRRDATAALLAPYCGDAQTLQSCLQCGVCTASCNLAGEDGGFPRKQMALIQLGQTEALLSDPDLWRCYNCSDCSTQCSSKARPGQIMAGLRWLAVERYALLPFLARAMSSARGLALVGLAAAVLLLLTLAAGGSFHPQTTPVLYASMLPHRTLNFFFTFFAGASGLCAVISVHRLWRAFSGRALGQVHLRTLLPAGWEALQEAVSHRDFRKCEQFPLAGLAHAAVMAGFFSLLIVALAVAVGVLLGKPYPLSLGHPLKIAGNAAGLALLLGAGYFAIQRWLKRKTESSTAFDWLLLANVLAVVVTGMMLETFRLANLAVLAYPAYFLHLVLALMLIAGLPFTKFAHTVYRVVALTSHRYDARIEEVFHEAQSKAA